MQALWTDGRPLPGARPFVSGQRTPVGSGGAFTQEVLLGSGANRITVRAVDAAGNANETITTVERLAAGRGEGTGAAPGPDWPFVAFIVASVSVMVLEGWVSYRRLRGRAGGGPAPPGHRAGEGPRRLHRRGGPTHNPNSPQPHSRPCTGSRSGCSSPFLSPS
ncbi:MAG: hypothetical protein QW379_09455 [Thermoplasmata archaeon]